MIYCGYNCGNCHLTILPTGDIYACRRVQNSRVGNVLTDRLADVWVCQMEAYRDYTRFEKCAKCRLLAFCRGCPAVASGKDGNFYAADALGIGSCYIGQGWTAFADPYGQEVLRRWGVGADYYAVMQLLLGYPREKDRHPVPKPRREGRVLRF